MISQEELKRLIDYNPETSVFTWKVSKGTARSGDETALLDNQGYRVIGINGKMLKAHKLAWLWVFGEYPDYIDHINGNRADNRISNLRLADDKRNSMNTKRKHTNKCGVKGVHWCKTHKSWKAQIQVNGKKVIVGTFPDLIGAELAVRRAREHYHGEFANHG